MINIDKQGASTFYLTTPNSQQATNTKQQVNLPKDKSSINLNKVPAEVIDGDKEFASRGGTIGFTDLTPYMNEIDLAQLIRTSGSPGPTYELGSIQRDVVSKRVSKEPENKEWDSFMTTLTKASQDTADSIGKLYSSSNIQKKTNLLTTISNSETQKNMNRFIETLTDFIGNKSETDLSNFLTTAANSEKNFSKLLDITSEVDLAFTSELSIVDTVNFLQAATRSDTDIDELTSTTKSLNGKDRSNFLYAAINNSIDASALIKETENLNRNIKSDYLLQMANYGQNTINNSVYMKGVLTDIEYQNFEATISDLEAYEVDYFVSVLTEQKGDDRLNFLSAANTADESADNFILKFSSLMEEDQERLLDLSSTLEEKDRKNLTKAFINKNGNVNDLINIIQDIQDNYSTGIGVEHFLKAASNANSKNLDDLIAITDKTLKQFDTILSSIKDNGNIGNFMDDVV